MAFALLAAAVVFIHGAFVAFAVLGGLLVLWRRRWAWLHLPALLWAAYIELTGGICPLTPLENRLRVLAGEAGYQGDFIGQYLLPLLYPADLTRNVQLLMGILLLAFNGLIYALAGRRARRARRHPAGADAPR